MQSVLPEADSRKPEGFYILPFCKGRCFLCKAHVYLVGGSTHRRLDTTAKWKSSIAWVAAGCPAF